MTPTPTDYGVLADELTALGEKATPGEWVRYEREQRSDCWRVSDKDDIIADFFMLREEDHYYLPYDRGEENSALIVALRNALPALTAALREAARLREALTNLLDAQTQDFTQDRTHHDWQLRLKAAQEAARAALKEPVNG